MIKYINEYYNSTHINKYKFKLFDFLLISKFLLKYYNPKISLIFSDLSVKIIKNVKINITTYIKIL